MESKEELKLKVDYKEIFKVSFDSLLRHKLRFFLTTLGIIFGVAAVIAMLSIGEGAKRDALEQIRLMGTNNIIIKAKTPPESKSGEQRSGASEGLTLGDSYNLQNLTSLVKVVVPRREEFVSRIRYKDMESKGKVVSLTPEYLKLLDYKVEKGRFFSEEDNQDCRQVSILGSKIKKDLFAFSNPLGEQIKLDDLWFTVIGVMEEKPFGKSKVEGLETRNLNEEIYIPLQTAIKKFDRGPSSNYMSYGGFAFMISRTAGVVSPLDEITVQVNDSKQVDETASLIKEILKRRHNQVEDFEVVVPEALLRQSQKTQRIFNIVMGCIAGISLLVGGIGIMNIMLATVMERTREIGIRRTVGAKKVYILRQFLVEACFISLIGCVIGLILGTILAKGINYYAHWRTIISFGSIILAVGVALGVGLGFGIYPAKRASELDPIEALRYE
jgi:putative ABC transport system permease protein